MATLCSEMGFEEEPPLGYAVVVEVSTLPSARTNTIDLIMVDASVMALPLATCQHGSASMRPSLLREGSPDTSCQMKGEAAGLAPVESVHRVGGSATEETRPPPPLKPEEYSSMKTADATPAAPTATDALPSRTTITEPAWKASTRGEGEEVGEGVLVHVYVDVGVPLMVALRLRVTLIVLLLVDEEVGVPL